MLDSLFSWLTFILNTPLFYLIILLLVLGYFGVATQRHLWRMHAIYQMGGVRHTNRSTFVRMARRHSEAVMCDECGRNIDHIAVRHTEEGERLLLCHSCSKQYGKMQ